MKKKQKKERSPNEKLILKARECYQLAFEADNDNRMLARADIRFVNVPGEQWDANMKKRRGKRPCYEFNKLRINGKRVINEIRANRPQGKVRATEGGDKQGADLREGLCRNIWAQSDGDTIIDNAAEYQVDGGMSAWRVVTEYASEDVFDQDIRVQGFKNPFCVWPDPNCTDPLKRDAEFWLVEDKVPKASYEERWPEHEKVEFEALGPEHGDDWEDGETYRVCEYWYKQPYTKEIWQIRTPKGPITVDMSSDEAPGVKAKVEAGEYQLIRKRSAKCNKILMCIMSGDAVLEGPVEWAGSQFPFVVVYGEHKIIDDSFKWWGLHRFAKDAQQSYNINRTSSDETVAAASKAKYWATPTMAKGNTDQWAQAHDENLPALISNPDPEMPQRFPERMAGAEVPVAMLELSNAAAQDIRDVTGLHEAAFGEESNEKSGIALARKQNQAQIVTYNFPDNMAKGIKRTWELMLDLIPHIYDAERELRILGADGAEDYVKINEVVPGPSDASGMPTMVRVNDMSAGKYDVTITVGPNFSTLRQEAAEIYGELGAKNPALMQVAGDLVFKSMDLPYADEIAKRWQTILPPPIQKQITEGKDIPPEAQAAMAQAEQAMQAVQAQGQMVQAAAQEVEQEKAKATADKAGVEKAIANLRTEEAKFQTLVANAKTEIQKALNEIAIREAKLDVRELGLSHENDKLAQEKDKAAGTLNGAAIVEATLHNLDALTSNFMANSQAMMVAEANMKKKAKPKSIKGRREKGGQLVAEIEYGEGDTTGLPVSIVSSRDANGALIGVPQYANPNLTG